MGALTAPAQLAPFAERGDEAHLAGGIGARETPFTARAPSERDEVDVAGGRDIEPPAVGTASVGAVALLEDEARPVVCLARTRRWPDAACRERCGANRRSCRGRWADTGARSASGRVPRGRPLRRLGRRQAGCRPLGQAGPHLSSEAGTGAHQKRLVSTERPGSGARTVFSWRRRRRLVAPWPRPRSSPS
jgi:hypothetical protein